MTDSVNLIVEYVFKYVQGAEVFAAVSTLFILFIFTFFIIHVYCKLTAGKCQNLPDLTGKTVIVTGANTGIGKVTAEELAKCGARVILACRSRERGQKAIEEMVSEGHVPRENLVLKQLDLCSFASIRSFAADILKNEPKLHILINNAGTAASAKRLITKDGCDEVMQCNYFGQFLLVHLLLDKLKSSSPSRIINVSSCWYKFGLDNFEDLNNERSYRGLKAYGKSKMAFNIFTRELAERLSGTGVTANCLHPGYVKTEITRRATGIYRICVLFLLFVVGKTPREGAQTQLLLAVAPELTKTTGKYFEDCHEVPLLPFAMDPLRAKKLWETTEKIVGLTK